MHALRRHFIPTFWMPLRRHALRVAPNFVQQTLRTNIGESVFRVACFIFAINQHAYAICICRRMASAASKSMALHVISCNAARNFYERQRISVAHIVDFAMLYIVFAAALT